MAEISGSSATPWEPWAIGRLQAFITTILGAGASIAFVAFTGGAVLWARAYSLGLPPDAIVAVLPKRELVATGASTLSGFAILGLLAAGVLYIFDRYGVPSFATRAGLVAVVAVELGITFHYADLSTWDLVSGCLLFAIVLGGLLAIARWSTEETGGTADNEETEEPTPPAPPAPVPPAGPVASDVSGLIATVLEGVRKWGAVTTPRDASPAPAPSAPLAVTVDFKGRALTIILLLLAVGGSYLLFEPWVAGAASMALGLYVVTLAIAQSSGQNFWATGLAAFVSVTVFGSAFSVLRYTETNQVQPIAALQTGEAAPICGIYVGEADDRLYLARLDRDRQVPGPTVDGATGHLFWLKRKDVSGWALGALQGQGDAQEALFRLNRRVVEERRTRLTHTHTEERKAGEKKIAHTAKKTISVVPASDQAPPVCSIYAI